MRAMHATDAHNNFAAVLDAATEDNDQVVITRSGGKEAAVVISLREWEAMTETAYLLADPANAAWLAMGIAQAEAGQATERELVDPDTVAEDNL
ncbi:type II toxin-antitoxin system prevent-host-death family antitoxin [Nocardia cyriacigeorgica]|uniref:Antitoxin n=3 Tax=Nocardia cyriacigeorgica TaxID=135487 RepID=A0A6P1DED7_9NOCA|nr:type II toxin-antitoxin system prevent-host-death family antitoxin [Nocardia cyriacigeorgica]NEW42413.1 type II toxin-antitoxin system prevent-host-death family antitoxin [Nocardia cyriacigeorgica]NEW47514.1 type II toxin-antitoxin system prevent-host-death family antitoxin [Nocardia cyriacigeorgica]NEW52620.1 type II toxin-antitoxin system prevent-host-death family antitoxin [Nocardia cyriacigeorgica]NEW59043.1 type II toxin-antitoxin system prevent-host-death family antitoxin [Nocardia cyr